MASNAQMLTHCGEQAESPPTAYMQASCWFETVLPTQPTRNWRLPISEEHEFLGVRFTFTRTDGTEFPPSLVHAFDKLGEFANLESNWDSYGGRSLQKPALRTCLRLMFEAHSVCLEPRLYPMKDGGVGMVWRAGESELEIQIAADGRFEGVFEGADGEEQELSLGSSLGDLPQFFEKLTNN